jgi:hypothetical protein
MHELRITWPWDEWGEWSEWVRMGTERYGPLLFSTPVQIRAQNKACRAVEKILTGPVQSMLLANAAFFGPD